MSFVLGILLGLSLLGPGVPSARATWTPPPDPHTALILANAHGDSAWFESESLLPSPRVVREQATDSVAIKAGFGDDRKPRLVEEWANAPPYHFTLRTSSKGLAVLVASRTASGMETDSVLLDHLASVGLGRCMASVLPEPHKNPAVYELGCFQDQTMRWPCGRELTIRRRIEGLDIEPWSPVRLTILVVGRPSRDQPARQGWADAPIPIRQDRRLRPYDLSSDDVRATARIVGEVILDFEQRLLLPQRVEGCSVVKGAARPR